MFAHDIITTKITWSTDIARIVFTRCAECHRPAGTAFSLLTYKEARPWAVAIKEEILTRRMPPWGATKGFGSFRNDMSLSPEEIERIVSWVDGGVPEAPEQDASNSGVGLSTPPDPPEFGDAAVFAAPADALRISGEVTLDRDFVLDGLWPESVPADASMRIIAQLSDGSIEPLLWLEGYRQAFAHPFLLKQPLRLPKGTRIHGVTDGAAIALLPVEVK